MMGCKIKTQVKLDYIQDFEMMFERMKIDRPREAAIYYVTLIVDCPKEFSDFLKITLFPPVCPQGSRDWMDIGLFSLLILLRKLRL